MLRRAKRPILQTLKRLGLHCKWIDSRWRRERLAILCYHGVALEDEHRWNSDLYMPVGLLEERLKILLEGGYNVLSLGEAIRRLYRRELPARSVVLTFDDGGYDFYKKVHPQLKKYHLPATVYLSTYYCYHRRPIFPLSCHYLLWSARDTFRPDKLRDWGCPSNADVQAKSGIEAVVRSIVAYANTLSPDEHHTMVERLARRLGLDYGLLLSKRLFQLMSPEEVASVAGDGVDIQLHTHRHRVPRDHDLFVREIRNNHCCILKMTGRKAIHFCYPSGVYDPVFLPWLVEQDVVSATTCEPGLASSKDHPLLLPRIVDTGKMSPIEFESVLAGISASSVRRGKRKAVRSS